MRSGKESTEFFKKTFCQEAGGNLVMCPCGHVTQRNYPMTQATIYRNTINDQCRAQDVQSFRQRHFYQWVYTDRFGYCMSHEGWPFFGFLRQQSEIVCLACTDDGAFYASRMVIASIEQALTRRLPEKAINDGEHMLMSLLDLAVNPDFFLSLPHKPVCPGLQLWEDDHTIIFVAQFASRSRGAETFWIDEAMGKNKKTGINLIPEQNAKKGGSDMTAVTISAGPDLRYSSGERVS